MTKIELQKEILKELQKGNGGLECKYIVTNEESYKGIIRVHTHNKYKIIKTKLKVKKNTGAFYTSDDRALFLKE